MNNRKTYGATRVGVITASGSTYKATRACCRCGISHQQNGRQRKDSQTPYVCRECRTSDPEYVRLIGL